MSEKSSKEIMAGVAILCLAGALFCAIFTCAFLWNKEWHVLVPIAGIFLGLVCKVLNEIMDWHS